MLLAGTTPWEIAMKPMRRILVGIKSTEAAALPALTKAAQIAKALDAEIELFQCLDETIYLDDPGQASAPLRKLQTERREQAILRLENFAHRIRRHGVSAWAHADWDFPAYEALIRRANKIGAELIVVERHLGKHHAPWLLSYTDWGLLRHAALPVLIVKSAQAYRHPIVLAAVDPQHAHAKPARLDDEILQSAAGWSAALRGKLQVVHAFSPPALYDGAAGIAAAAIATDLIAGAEHQAATMLTELLAVKGVKPATMHVVNAPPAVAIPATAQRIGARIVVMGAVSRSALKRIFIGNTAEQVLDALPCDVLVVKPPGFATDVARRSRGVRVAVAPIGAVA
jgi:universal stress protein E